MKVPRVPWYRRTNGMYPTANRAAFIRKSNIQHLTSEVFHFQEQRIRRYLLVYVDLKPSLVGLNHS
jgi:hypothetical protein